MENVIYKLSFDLTLTSPQHLLRSHTGEGNLRCIEATFFSGDEAFSLSKIKEVKIRGEQDGNIIYDDCEISENKVLYTIKSDFFKTKGIKKCQFTLYDENGNLLAAPCFKLEVLPLIYSDEELKATSDFSALITAKTKAENAAKTAYDMVESVLEIKDDVSDLLHETEEMVKKAEGVKNEMRAEMDKSLMYAKKALSNPPVLISAGEITKNTSDIRINLGGKIYGEITVYLTIPPSYRAQNWGFYTYFDDFWTLHTDHNSGNSKASGILPDKYSFVRINSRYDGGHWVSESGNYWSDTENSGWSANTSLITRGKSKGEERPFIESIRFVSDYMPSYSQGDTQIPFPSGTHWEIYGRLDPEITPFEYPEKRTVSSIGLYELMTNSEKIVIDTDNIKSTNLSLKGRFIAYIEIPPVGEAFGISLLGNGKTIAEITNGSEVNKFTAINLEAEYTGIDFSVKWIRTANYNSPRWVGDGSVSGMLRTDFFGDQTPIITKLELKSNSGLLLPIGTRISLFGARR